jgi:hypothetical protein
MNLSPTPPNTIDTHHRNPTTNANPTPPNTIHHHQKTAPTQARPNQAVFRVSPSMNKMEVREYLTKIYGLSVQKVMTANFAGALGVCFACVYVVGGVWIRGEEGGAWGGCVCVLREEQEGVGGCGDPGSDHRPSFASPPFPFFPLNSIHSDNEPKQGGGSASSVRGG